METDRRSTELTHVYCSVGAGSSRVGISFSADPAAVALDGCSDVGHGRRNGRVLLPVRSPP